MARLAAWAELVVSSRRARLLLAFAFLAVAGWAFLPHIAYRIAPTAFVNAQLIRVTAPMTGRLAPGLPRKGDMIDQAIMVNLTETLAPDRGHLSELEQQAAVAKNRANLAEQQIAEIASIDRELEARMEAYRDAMILRLGQEIAEAEAEKSGCLAEVSQRRDIGSRMDQLVRSGYASQIRSAEVSVTQEANAARCEMTQARIKRFRIEL